MPHSPPPAAPAPEPGAGLGPQGAGPGGTIPEDILEGTALKNAVADSERFGLGLSNAPETVQQNMVASMMKAERMGPEEGRQLAAELIANPERGLNDVESAMLLRHKKVLMDEMNDAASRSHVGDKDARAKAQLEYDRLTDEFQTFLDAVKERGSEWGREGRWRQAILKENFDFESRESFQRARKAVSGKDFTPKEEDVAEKKSKVVKKSADETDAAGEAIRTHLKNKSEGGTDAEKKAQEAVWAEMRFNAKRIADVERKAAVAEGERAKLQHQVEENAKQEALEKVQKRGISYELKKIREKAKSDLRAAELRAKQARVQADAEKKAIAAVQKSVQKNAMKLAESARKNAADPSIRLWKQASQYLDQGVTDFDDIRNKLATDLGMKVEQVTRLLSADKRAKFLIDDLWAKKQAERRLKQQAKNWVANLDVPKLNAALAFVPRALFSIRVGFHGTVALGTHAPTLAFQPEFWSTYVRNFGKMYKMVGSPAYYEMQMQDLMRRPNYIKSQRFGLENNPGMREEYANPDFTAGVERLSPTMARWIENLTGMGNRGYSVLKILRQDIFDQQWNVLPKTLKIKGVGEEIVNSVNHVTGIIQSKAPAGASLIAFAPRLEVSRAAWIFGDPWKAAKIGSNWKNATPAEKQFAIRQVKEKAWVLGTYMSLLAINKGILAATGSKQQVNMSDPTKGDFMKFKVAGMDVSYGNAMLTMARFPIRIETLLDRQGGKLKNIVYPDEDVYTATGEYVRSQLSPVASLAVDLQTKEDWQRRQLPSSNRPEPKRLRDEGIKPYTWAEFWGEQALPIPFQEAAREVWRNGMGMNPKQIEQTEQAAASTLVNAATGGRAVEDIQPKPTNQPRPIKYLAPMP